MFKTLKETLKYVRTTYESFQFLNIYSLAEAKDLKWMDWKFEVEMKVTAKVDEVGMMPEKITAVINLLQAAIIIRDTEMVKLIEQESPDPDKVFNYELTFLPEDKGKIANLTVNCLWIVGASAIHLATFWHCESLAHLLKKKPELRNKITPNYKIAPLHIASFQENSILIRLLIHCKADIEAQTAFGHTALHLAAMTGHANNVMLLVFEGKANVLAKNTVKVRSDCRLGETPIHHAKTGKIIRILLSKTTPKQLMEIDTIEDRPLFDQFLKHHPSTLKSYLDLMVTSKNDLENDDPHLIFDLSMFDYKKKNDEESNKEETTTEKITRITKKANQMDKHLRLMEEDRSELLTHPVMTLFMHLKWHPNVVPYFINFLIFFMFLFVFSSHALLTVDFLQCDSNIGSSG